MAAWQECKRKLDRIESVRGRQNELRREINLAIRAGGNPMHLSQKLDAMWTPTFCEKDYVSGDGFQTAVWGPAAWHYLHITSLNYAPKRKKQYKMLLDGFAGTLPCVHCRNNFPKNLKSAKKAMKEQGYTNVWKDRESYSRFIWQLHHEVNVMLDKCTKNEPSYEEMRDELEMFRSRCLTPEEIEKEKRKKKEGGCLDSPYGADAKSRLILMFVPRTEDDLNRVHSLNIDPKCRVQPRGGYVR